MHAQNCEAVVLHNSRQAGDIYLLTAGLPAGAAMPKSGQFYMLRAWACLLYTSALTCILCSAG